MKNYDGLMRARRLMKYEQMKWRITWSLITGFFVCVRFSQYFDQIGPVEVVDTAADTSEYTEIITYRSIPATEDYTTSSSMVQTANDNLTNNEANGDTRNSREQTILQDTTQVQLQGGSEVRDTGETTSKGDRNGTPPVAKDTNSTSEQLKEKEVVEVKRNEPIPPAICSTGGRSNFCDLKGDIRVDPSSWTVYYVAASETDTIHLVPGNGNTSSFTVRPYARNDDPYAMATVREWSVKMVSPTDPDLPFCYEIHDAAGVIFSLAGYAGHRFHLFTDVLVPLFATARSFDGEVELLITDYQSWLVPLLKHITGALSRYNVVDIDREQEGQKTHCFSTVTLGLKGRQLKELSINPLESTYTMSDFMQFLRDAYSLKKTTAMRLQVIGDKKSEKPQLLIISRKSIRSLTNLRDIARMATGLGFQVRVAEAGMDLTMAAQVMNSCDAVIGVHGSDLTNMVFLPDNAVFIQIVPVAIEWASTTFYEEPSGDMNLRYLEYKIGREESSLAERYPPDDIVFTDPKSFEKKGWGVFKSIYLDNQNVTLDTRRFRPTLLKALAMFSQPNRTFNW